VPVAEFLDLLTLSISGINILPTFFLLIVIIYWAIVIMGAVDIDGLDVDIDLDAEGIGADIFTFLKIGDVPFSVYISILTLLFWILNMVISILTQSWGGIPNIIGLIPALVVAALLTRFLTIPLKIGLNGINGESEKSKEIIGCVGVLKFGIQGEELGQVLIDNGVMLINCQVENELSLPAGASVEVLEKKENENFYIVKPVREME